MPLSLQNKKIIISAGASGIGWATAKICLSKGARVFICDIDNKLREKFGVPKKLGFIEGRATYIIDSNGYISNVYDKVQTKTHALDILSSL